MSDAFVDALQGIGDCRNVSEVHLATITSLDLSGMSVSSLLSDDFSGLLSLTSLNLSNNQLDSLPDGIFEDLTSLTTLNLSGNTVDPLPLTLSLQKVGTNRTKAVLPKGAPYTIMLPITVSNGNLGGDVSTITIPAGSIESQPITVLRNTNTTGAVTVNIGSLPSLPVEHTGYALAKFNDLPLEIFSDINVAPVFSEGTTATRTIPENTEAGVDIGSAVSATDGNSDDLTYSLSGTDATSFDIDDATGQLKTKSSLDYESKASYSVAITVSDGSLTDSITVTISVSDVEENRAPVFTEGSSATRTVAENTGSGVDIGNPVTATDADEDTLTYTLNGTDAASFSINSPNGQIRTSAALDYEDKPSYTVKVNVSDGNEGSDSITVTVNVTDVDERPANTAPEFTEGSTATRSVAENTGSGVDIGSAVSATDENEDTLTYSLSGTDASSFSINSISGQLQTSAALDYETKSSYSVTLTVSDGSLSDSIDVTINITDIDETPVVDETTDVKDTSQNNPPVFTEGESATRSVAENTGSGVDIGSTVSATDADKDTLTYSLDGTDADSFSINSTNGQIRTSAALDYETKSSYSVTITVDDGNEGIDSITVTINVTDVDENTAPEFTEGSTVTRSIAENSGSGVDIGNPVTATDADEDTLTYSLSGTDATSFSINSISGQLQTSAALDYETKSSYSVTLTVSDGSLSDSIDVTINITDIDETPVVDETTDVKDDPPNNAPEFTEGESATRSVAENTGSGVDIGSAVSATDADKNTLTYSLSGTDAASFNINSTNGQIRTSAALDYEDKSSYEVKVNVSDGNEGIDSITVTINVTDVDENTAPEFTEGSTATRSIAENTGSGVDIGSAVSATDDDEDTLTYSLSGTNASSFSINSSSGQIRTSASLDYETKSSYTVTVNVSDGEGGSDSITVTINLTDVDEAPTNNSPEFSSDDATRSVAENTDSDTNIGSPVSATDDDDDTLTYSLGGTDAATFDIDSETGQLQTKDALDFETKSSYTVTVNVSDGEGGSDSIDVTIDVSNVNEAPAFIDGTSVTRAIAENARSNVNIGSAVAATDVDANTTLTYSLGGTDAASFSIDEKTGQLKTKAALDFETKASYTVTVSVTDGSLSESLTVSISVRDLDETPSNIAPVFSDGEDTTRSVPENTVEDTDIGEAIAATDEDSDTLAYLLGGTDASSFSIDDETGQLKTSAALDYEDKNSYTVTVTVSDGSLEDEITVTINVSNVNEAPVFEDGENTIRRIAENTTSGVDFGRAFVATDPDANTTLTYTLEGDDAASFDFNSTTKRLQTKAALDYEDTSSYSVALKVSDGELTSSIAITIMIRDVDENRAPVFEEGSETTRSVAENTGSGEDIGDAVSATDADEDTLTYSLGGTDETSFSINSTNGQLRTKAALDFETKKSYSVEITVSDDNGGEATIEVTINVTNVDENTAPEFAEGETATRSVAENTGSGLDIGTAVEASDADEDELEYTLGGTNSASFNINSTSGQLRTKDALDFETKDSYTVTVTVSDGSIEDKITVTINVTDANDSPKFTQTGPITFSIAEHTAANVNIGSPFPATDQDGDDFEYSIGGTDGSSFNIDTDTGQIKTKDALNHEANASHSVTVTVTDDSGESNSSTSIDVTINVSDQNDAPVFTETSPATRAIAENTDADTNIGDPIAATDEDGDDLEYSLGGTDAASFSIDDDTGQIKTKDALDFEDDASYSVTVTATDDSGESNDSATIDVEINITDVDENRAPTFSVTSFSYRISDIEDASAGDNIGDAITATDPDNDTLTYSVSGDDAAKFDIDSSGQLKVTQALIDDTKTIYDIKVIVDDSKGGKAEVSGSVIASGRISRQVLNNAPTFDETDPVTRSIAENTPADTDIGEPVSASDDDTDDTLTYSLEGTDADTFSIVSTSGQLKTSAPLDYEDTDSYSVTVKVTDDSGASNDSATIDVTINITDVINEITPVSQRTAEVRRAIVRKVQGKTNAADITTEDLAGIMGTISLASQKIPSLKAGDFDGLTGLKGLDLDDNEFDTYPEGIFDDLTALTNLELKNNDIMTLPTGIFDNLSSLEKLDLGYNDLSSLPENIFENLTSLKILYLDWNAFGSIPHKTFVGLTSLNQLDIDDQFDMEDNRLDPLPLSIVVEKVQDGEFKAVAPTGAPFNISVPITVSNGSITGGATSVTISKGDTESSTLTVTRTSGTTDPVVASIGNLPNIPSRHDGYELTKGTALDVFRTTNNAPTFTEGSSTTRTIIENVPPEIDIGDPVSATDADLDRLTYTLGGTDAASFSINSTTGQLRTKDALDHEMKSSYSVTVTATDTYNGSASITVTINITDLDETPLTVPLSDRSQKVQNAIIGMLLGVTNAADVVKGHLDAITYLDLSNAGIGSLQANDFSDFTALTTLNLRDNPLTTLPAGVFDPLTSLTTLNLIFNDLTSIPSGVFDELTALTYLHLDYNEIPSLPSGIFDELTALTELHLGQNDLTSLPSGIFDELTALTFLNISGNELTSLPSGIFNELTALIDLYIYDNELSSLDADIFSELTNLVSLGFGGYNLTSLPDGLFAGLSNLRTLEIDRYRDGHHKDDLIIFIKFVKVADGQFKVICPVGSPQIVRNKPELTNGTLSDQDYEDSYKSLEGTPFESVYPNDLNLEVGATESGIVDVIRDNNSAVTVNAYNFAMRPVRYAGHSMAGFTFLYDLRNLPLEIIPADNNNAPENHQNLPDETAFLSNFPNPFNPETWIPYQLAKSSDVTITIYDMKGVVVRKLELGHKPAGYYIKRRRAAHWDGRNHLGESVATGIYFATFKAGDFTSTRKMLILK